MKKKRPIFGRVRTVGVTISSVLSRYFNDITSVSRF